jgi:nitronate monooxygenase
MKVNTAFTEMTGIRFPVIMAPMFLVSNVPMMEAAIDNGIMGVFPSLNFREENKLNDVLSHLKAFQSARNHTKGSYGVNLIVQKTNIWFEKHLELCVHHRVPFYITSLGNPSRVIQKAHEYGAKVFCDVTNLEHAEKAMKNGCDGFIAVGQGAGGHAGPFPLSVLIPALTKKFPKMPVVAAGGIANGAGLLSALALGASAVSIGTRFIATHEAKVSDEYKNAVVQAGMNDIVLTERISGTPSTIINTPFVKKIGLKQNWVERWLSRNPRTKKYFKMLVQKRGMSLLEKAIMPGNYKNLWCAGQSVELIDDIVSCSEAIIRIEAETARAWEQLNQQFRPQ